MSKIGKMFVMKSLEIPKIEIIQKARGEYERLNLSVYLFIYRRFCGRKESVAKVEVLCKKVCGSLALELSALPGEEKSFGKFYRGIQRYADEELANFLIWRRSNKEKIRKIPYHKVWDFTQKHGQNGEVLIPIDPGYLRPSRNAVDRYLTVSIWVPHEEPLDPTHREIKIIPSHYPTQEDWRRHHQVYVEWTKQHEHLPENPRSESSEIMQQILEELETEFEDEIKQTKVVLRRALRNAFSSRYCILLEMLSSALDKYCLSPEEKLQIISMSIFGD